MFDFFNINKRKKCFNELFNNRYFLEAVDIAEKEVIKIINEKPFITENQYNFEFNTDCYHFNVYLKIDNENFSIYIRDTRILNDFNKPFVLLFFEGKIPTHVVSLEKIEVPYQKSFLYSTFSDNHGIYSKNISKWSRGNLFLARTLLLFTLLHKNYAMSKPKYNSLYSSDDFSHLSTKDSESRYRTLNTTDIKELVLNQIKNNDLQTTIINLITYIEEHNTLIQEQTDVEFVHEVERMLSVELKDIISIYSRLNESNKIRKEEHFISIVKAMKHKVSLQIDSIEKQNVKKLESKFSVLEERYQSVLNIND